MIDPETNVEYEYYPRWQRILLIPNKVIHLAFFVLFKNRKAGFSGWWMWTKWTVGVACLPADSFEWLMAKLDESEKMGAEEASGHSNEQ